jgi:7-cyano-7-deazaguanine synthase
LLSGGQDSATCLFWSLRKFDVVEAVTFDYGQRHSIELEASQSIASIAGVKQTILPVNTFKALGGSSLTSDLAINNKPKSNNLPNTFVPGRNIIFLTYSAAYAYQRDISNIVGGMCQADYSGYPDCRDHTIKSIERSISFGMDYSFTIHTPIMFLSKKEIWKLAYDLGQFDTVKNITHSCYGGIKGGCGKCSACIIRNRGLSEFELMMEGK